MAYENKIASGMGDSLFAPDKPVTRGEMAVIITNYMKFIGKGTAGTAALNYTDAAEIDSWGLEGVRFVTENGLMTGTSGNQFEFD
ncbi:MAG TPA: S-layer homology domain-containing protein, partial [Clostridia bacterium]|nr:S-layer homology domain-containing protein [Clostridia bacterium]